MKVYVASKFENQERVQEVQAMLKALGHTITFDWTTFEQWKRKEAAKLDKKGVMDCDFILILMEKDYRYNGTLTEMGIAIGSGKDVHIVGVNHNDNIFTELEEVTIHETWTDFLNWHRRNFDGGTGEPL